MVMILFPSAYGDIHRIDEEFVREYDAVYDNSLLHRFCLAMMNG